MVIVRLTGGLGNQMFQYAAAKKIALLFNVELKSDLSDYTQNHLRKYELNCFKLDLPEATLAEIKKITVSDAAPLWKRIKNKIVSLSVSYKHIQQPPFHFTYYKAIETASPNTYLEGSWQSEKYFKTITHQLKKDFAFKKTLTGNNKSLADQIEVGNSVAVHIRRGDYILNDITNEFHGTCSLNYYQKSIDYIQSKVEKPSFYIFSDDPAWAVNNLKLGNGTVTFVNHNSGDASYEDMRLMSLCKHNILANSSFSWWGAWLNPNPKKMVIAPQPWFNPESRWFKQYKIDTSDILPENWIKMSN